MTTCIKTIFVLCQVCLFSTVVFAAEARSATLPNGCKEQHFSFVADQLILGSEQGEPRQHYYLLKNITEETIVLNHESNEPLSAGWAAELRPQHWSALAVDRVGFSLVCEKLTTSKRQRGVCKDLLQACELANAHHDSNAIGTYWVAEDKRLPELLERVKERHITP